jgi:hypothetical protein
MVAPMTWTRAAILACALLAACGGKVAVDSGGGTHTLSSGGAGGVGTGGTGGTGAVACNPGGVLCESLPPTCLPGQVPSVVAGCWGPCVGILSCATEPDCSFCQTGFCAEYQSWTTEFRCVLPTIECQAFACSCLAQYFCVSPYDGCSTSTSPGLQPSVTCECTTC